MTSRIPRFNVICEGPADYGVIEAALVAILNDMDFVLQRIQPPESLYGGDAGPHGGGWKGVRSWCDTTRAKWGSVGDAKISFSGDLLIIHLDADVAHEQDIKCAEACPPASKTVENLRALILQWMGDTALPNWIVLCTPSKDTDAWVLTAIYPQDEWATDNIECRLHPAERLRNKPEKLVRLRDGRHQKNSQSYFAIAHRLSEAWPYVVSQCSEAARFDSEFRQSFATVA